MAQSECSANRFNALLEAGAQHNGSPTVQAAIHLLTFTELPHHRGFDRLIHLTHIEHHDGTTTPIALVCDWQALPNAPTALYLGGADWRLLTLAIALATGKPVPLRENLAGFGHAHARRVIEAVAIATGASHYYTVTPTPHLEAHLAEVEALTNG